MGDARDKSMSYPQVYGFPLTENADGNQGVNLIDLQNPEIVFAWVDHKAEKCKIKNKELQVKVPIEYVTCISALKQRGFDTIVQRTDTIVQRTDKYIVLKKGKACTGSTKTKTLCIKKLDKLAGQLPPTSNVNPVVPRGNIASSSNPHNLICSQAPVATLAVQTPSKSAGEQFHQLLHSSPDSPSDPVGVGSEIPECGVQTKKRRYDGPDLKVSRGPPFQVTEKGLVLKYKSVFLKDPANAEKRNKWSTFVSDIMMENRSDQDPWRTPSAVRGQWDNLKKGRDALLEFTPPNTNYWDLKMERKRAIRKENPNFPLEFDYEWFLIMEDIDKMEGRTAANKETQRDGQEVVFSQSLASTITVTENFTGAGSSDANIQALVPPLGQASAQGSDKALQFTSNGPGAFPFDNDSDYGFSDAYNNLRTSENQFFFDAGVGQLDMLREDVEFILTVLENADADFPAESNESEE